MNIDDLMNNIPHAKKNLTKEELGTIYTVWNIFHKNNYPNFEEYVNSKIENKKKYGSIHGELID